MSAVFESLSRCALECHACPKNPGHCGELRHMLVKEPASGRVLSLLACFTAYLEKPTVLPLGWEIERWVNAKEERG